MMGKRLNMLDFGLRILLIEDDPAEVEIMGEALADGGHAPGALVAARTLEEGMKLLAREGFDLVLLDLGLPDSRGYCTFERVKEIVYEVPVVVVAGPDDEDLAIRAVHEGAQDYLLKGDMEGGRLAQSICCALERHSLLRRERSNSLRDELTGLYNGRGFDILAEKRLETARRLMRPVCLLCADLDHLKLADDSLGRAEGDRALAAVASALRKTFRRKSDLMARVGAVEFAVLAFKDAGRDCGALEGMLRRNLEEGGALRQGPGRISMGVGAMEYDPRATSLHPDIEELMAWTRDRMREENPARPRP